MLLFNYNKNLLLNKYQQRCNFAKFFQSAETFGWKMDETMEGENSKTAIQGIKKRKNAKIVP